MADKVFKRRSITKRTRFQILERDNRTCVYCGAKSPNVELVIDHVIPISKGGDNSINNLVCCCDLCNDGKGDMIIFSHPTTSKIIPNLIENINFNLHPHGISVDEIIIDSDINGSELFLLLHIAKYMDDENSCVIPNFILKRDTKWSLKKIQKAKVSLHEKGLLEITHNKINGLTKANTYRVKKWINPKF